MENYEKITTNIVILLENNKSYSKTSNMKHVQGLNAVFILLILHEGMKHFTTVRGHKLLTREHI